MRDLLLIGAVLAASVSTVTAQHHEKRWSETYANAVKALTYDNAAASGSYNRVTSIDPDSGACAFGSQDYSGSLGPLADDLSIHLRGPLKLSRFAAYSSDSPRLKRRSRHFHEHRRRAQAKQHAEEEERVKMVKRGCGDWVTATYPANGIPFSFRWTEGCGAAAVAAPTAAPVAPLNIANAAAVPPHAPAVPTAAPAPPAAAAPASPPSPPASTPQSSGGYIGGGKWAQTGYYNAATKEKSGVTFLNNMGAAGVSGGWTAAMGNSLSYAAEDGCSAASSAQVLGDVLLPSNKEVIIMSDKQCGAQGTDCGAYRPDGVNYHGFSGSQRAFFWEFTMPDVPADNGAFNGNMPAIWLLNAQIPRTQQYGSCSAWPGAGELDIAEALASGETRLKATLHGNLPKSGVKGFNAGSDNYFSRPTGDSIILGVVLADSKISIKVLDKSQFDFSAGAGAAAVEQVTRTDNADNGLSSLASVY